MKDKTKTQMITFALASWTKNTVTIVMTNKHEGVSTYYTYSGSYLSLQKTKDISKWSILKALNFIKENGKLEGATEECLT